MKSENELRNIFDLKKRNFFISLFLKKKRFIYRVFEFFELNVLNNYVFLILTFLTINDEI